MITPETILTRKSVRSYDGRPIEAGTLAKIEAFAHEVQNPFGVPVSFVFLDAKERGLSSPVLTGEPMYVAGKVGKELNGDVAFGYAMEHLLLYAWSLGVGSVWIGGTMKREQFEQAAGKEAGERMPCVSPLGYPAAKKSLRETVMRRGVGADSRLPGEKLFFCDSFDTPLSGKAPEPCSDLLEFVRWAPSAVNKQPWRAVVSNNLVHFYEKRSRGYVSEATGDLQRIDVGIALCHFDLTARELGLSPSLTVADPGISSEDDTQYVATFDID